MGFVRTIAQPLLPRDSRIQAAIPPADTITTLDSFFGARTQAGQTVTYERALTLTAVFAAIRVLADSVAVMPLVSFRETGNRRDHARDLPVYRLLREEPNPEMTPAECWGTVIAHLNLDGNAFLGKQFDQANRIEALWPIPPDRVRIARNRGQLVFLVKDENGVERPKPYTAAEIVHIRGMSIDGIRGLSPISLAREAIGAGLAIDEYANRWWQQGAMPSAVLKSDKTLNEDAAKKLAARAQRLYGGTRNRGRIIVLEDGVTWQQVSLSQADTGFLDQHRVSVEGIARIFRVPLSKIQAVASGDSMTYRNLEMDQLQFWTDSVMTWGIRIEQALRRDPDLFPTIDTFPEFQPDNLLRADAKTRAEVNRIALGGARYKLPSEVRPAEGLPPDERLDELALQGPEADIGLLAQRLGLAASYEVLTREETREILAENGASIDPAADSGR